MEKCKTYEILMSKINNEETKGFIDESLSPDIKSFEPI